MKKLILDINKHYSLRDMSFLIADVLKFHVVLYHDAYKLSNDIVSSHFKVKNLNPYDRYNITEKDKEELEKQISIYILQNE